MKKDIDFIRGLGRNDALRAQIGEEGEVEKEGGE